MTSFQPDEAGAVASWWYARAARFVRATPAGGAGAAVGAGGRGTAAVGVTDSGGSVAAIAGGRAGTPCNFMRCIEAGKVWALAGVPGCDVVPVRGGAGERGGGIPGRAPGAGERAGIGGRAPGAGERAGIGGRAPGA